MPGTAGLCALLLCLLLPGHAQELGNGTDADVSWTRTMVTASPPVTSADLGDVTSSVSGLTSVTPGDEGNETVTEPPAAETPAATRGSGTGAPSITTGSPEPPTNSTEASTNPESGETPGTDLTQSPPTRSVTDEATPEPLSRSPPHPETTHHPSSTEPHREDPTPTTGTPGSTTAVTTEPPTPTQPHTTRAQEQRGPSALEEDESHKDEFPIFRTGNSSNPLFVMIVSVFTIVVVMVVVVVGFRRYKKRNRRTEFRRLQDLPMDDMMEDTPLSLYSY